MAKLFLSRILNKSGPPVHLIWFITSECNLRCNHCFYYRQLSSKRDELSFKEIEKVIAQLPPLLSVSLTGGEPFLREDLADITRLLSEKNIAQNIMLFSNGFNTEKILGKSREILSACRKANVFITVSLDGFEKEHDEYRNMAGCYKSAAETIKGLKSLENCFPNFKAGVVITMHNKNQGLINELRKDIYAKFGISPGINIIRGDPRVPGLKDVEARSYVEAIKAIEFDAKKLRKKNLSQAIISARETLGHKLILETLTKHCRSYDCYAGSLMGVIYENGDVFPCEMLPEAKMGNLRDYDYDLNKIWGSQKALEVRRFIGAGKCFCTYECQYTCNTLYNSKFLPVFIRSVLEYFFNRGCKASE